jgi:hypothetical protein
VGLEVVKYVLRFRLRFSDTWRPQIETIKSFMEIRGIFATGVQREVKAGRRDAFRFDINAVEGVLRAAKAMLPYCVKKAEDLRILIDYLEGRISGNQAVERYNQEVRTGRRSGFIREMMLPYTRHEGLRLAKLENARKARAAYTVEIAEATQAKIRDDHARGLGHIRLGRKYGYSAHVIRRILEDR